MNQVKLLHDPFTSIVVDFHNHDFISNGLNHFFFNLKLLEMFKISVVSKKEVAYDEHMHYQNFLGLSKILCDP